MWIALYSVWDKEFLKVKFFCKDNINFKVGNQIAVSNDDDDDNNNALMYQ